MTKYKVWTSYFHYNAWRLEDFPWPQSPSLSPEERACIAASLPQFQLGEGSDGLGLLRRARALEQKQGVEGFSTCMKRFIQEEQRHSAVLGRFLDQEQIPRLSKDWVDGGFRWLRNLAGIELMLSVLVSAECIAVPYYEAVHDATASPVLKAITRRILRDEAQHLEFQADNLALCAQNRADLPRVVGMLLQMGLLTMACVLVYTQHRRLFQRASMSFPRFWDSALSAQRTILRRLAAAPQVANLKWDLNLLD
jgi:hypothetical protein